VKAILEFTLPEETEEYELAMNGAKAAQKLDDVWNHVFRPHYKHGYPDEELQTLAESKNGRRLIDLLAQRYKTVVNDEFE